LCFDNFFCHSRLLLAKKLLALSRRPPGDRQPSHFAPTTGLSRRDLTYSQILAAHPMCQVTFKQDRGQIQLGIGDFQT
jgi:hypothetical protein